MIRKRNKEYFLLTGFLEKNRIRMIVLRKLVKPVVRKASYGGPFAIYEEIGEIERKMVSDI